MAGPEPSDRSAGPDATGATAELDRERTFGGAGVAVEREIPRIDLSDHDRRRDQIDDQLWEAASEVGFFQLVGHGIEARAVDDAFRAAADLFALPAAAKRRFALPPGTNSGWEHRSQVRPSTSVADEKESYQITLSRMDRLDLWPGEDVLPGFRATVTAFERHNHGVAMVVLDAFARRLGFPPGFFSTVHDPASPSYQSTLRLLHYLPVGAASGDDGRPRWRAGAHTDFDCLTLLHQLPGQGGLQVCPGRDSDDAARAELAWTEIVPEAGVITCNIGDMLVRWSDDALRSTLHRVRMPAPGEHRDGRYSIAFFAQADTDAVIQGPGGRYGPVTAGDYLRQRIEANFSTPR